MIETLLESSSPSSSSTPEPLEKVPGDHDGGQLRVGPTPHLEEPAVGLPGFGRSICGPVEIPQAIQHGGAELAPGFLSQEALRPLNVTGPFGLVGQENRIGPGAIVTGGEKAIHLPEGIFGPVVRIWDVHGTVPDQ